MNKLILATLLSFAFLSGRDDAKNESALNATQGNQEGPDIHE